MKILLICNFTSGGVWSRVKEEALQFEKQGHEVRIFCSSKELVVSFAGGLWEEEINGLHVTKFKEHWRVGYAVWFDLTAQALEYDPDVIIAHGFRKPFLKQVLKIKEQIKCKAYLVTHAPFLEKGIRKWYVQWMVDRYDKTKAKRILNGFDKVIAISKWEIPYLKQWISADKIVYIPNSISDKFFDSKRKAEQRKRIIFVGRVHRIKDLMTLVRAHRQSDAWPDYGLVLLGEVDDRNYYWELNRGYTPLNLKAENQEQVIEHLDKSEIFVLPSKREGVPIAMIEAMARGKICISSRTQGGAELIEDGVNGYLFDIGDVEKLTTIINGIIVTNNENIKAAAKQTAEQFKSSEVIKKWSCLFDEMEKVERG
jgi:glycosyltransferase involved in cell wall biosynthesis